MPGQLRDFVTIETLAAALSKFCILGLRNGTYWLTVHGSFVACTTHEYVLAARITDLVISFNVGAAFNVLDSVELSYAQLQLQPVAANGKAWLGADRLWIALTPTPLATSFHRHMRSHKNHMHTSESTEIIALPLGILDLCQPFCALVNRPLLIYVFTMSSLAFRPRGLIKSPIMEVLYRKAHIANVFTGITDPKEYETTALAEVMFYTEFTVAENFIVNIQYPPAPGSTLGAAMPSDIWKRTRTNQAFSLKALEKQASDYCKVYLEREHDIPFVMEILA
ncbi:uncharacterized protein BDR25DRAFT_359338 [Lindgomyces ingoldianus]|uniref:Uncharacterized protein n=1 Tax=Lindgomyces ingoldianus TaxID=673940 RepID=A0ACB6QIR3_9PLEO|nr:uncharacterized protein BDR25DRAFT_359338 [Lindgomyces ingoldianus]KAF2466833.1 hypothetical protein BDR25DRAFT_359338 [Lindgomyces ingoldianus]